MEKNEIELWKSHPEIQGVEVSTLGKVRTFDRIVPCRGNGTRLVKGHVLKQQYSRGYVHVSIKVDGKFITKNVHRLVAQTFIPNPDNLPEVNHKSCDRDDNRVSNLEWCSHSYNMRYREKFGIPNTETLGLPLFAIKIDTLEVLHFRSQQEAGRALKISQASINGVIKGKYKQAGGFWFKEDDGNGIEIDKSKLNNIVDGAHIRQGVFAISLSTLEVFHFHSQAEASAELGVGRSHINDVIKGRLNKTVGYWFTNADENADDIIKRKLNEIKGVANGH